MIQQKAKQLADMGFNVFPLIENGSKPAIKNYTGKATTDLDAIEKTWFDSSLELYRANNIGIATTNFKTGSLLVLDVDNKKGKDGNGSVAKLKAEGLKLPKTLYQVTPNNGLHLIYFVEKPVPNSVEKIAPGLDVRGKGGYIVGAGSVKSGKEYTMHGNKIAPAPQWLIDKACADAVDARTNKEPDKKISQKAALTRAANYLQESAPVAVEGSGGDQTTFIVASRLKDIGLTKPNALAAMLENWNDNCQPPWSEKELKAKIKNAYAYGQNSIGADSPENDFTEVDETGQDVDDAGNLGPIEKLNERFSFVVLGGKSTILEQRGNGEVNYMGVQAFHDLLAAETIQTGNGKKKQLSEFWFSSHKRNTFSSVQLVPGEDAPEGVYNLWRGFKVEPLGVDETPTPEMLKGVAMFKEHALKNICLGNEELCTWLLGYFAHLVQRPGEKPLTALVFKGKKGVGKNALIDRIGNLFNGHYLTTSNKRYLLSNFNKHLANLVLFVLDEASWAGDKQAEGILKDLITGHTHLIEHKGREMFSAANVLRVVIIGNESWVVPASGDERRFAVFNIGDERRQDRPFFTEMKNLIDKQGGNRLLLRELLAFDLSSVDINDAPVTEGLLEQKIESLNSVHGWFYASLRDGAFLNLDFSDDGWPTLIGREQLRQAYSTYAKERGIRSWLPDPAAFGRDLQTCCPTLKSKRVKSGNGRAWSYALPELAEARRQFNSFIGQDVAWDQDEPESNVIELFT